MQESQVKTKMRGNEIDLFEIIDILFESKKIIIITTFIVTISAFLYTLQELPTYKSGVLIEIGHYEYSDGSIELIQEPNSLINDLNINVKLKSDNNIESSILNVKEEKLIEIQYSSKSTEKNIDILNQFVDYLDIRHSKLANSKYIDKKTKLTQEFDNIISEIEFTENLLKEQNRFAESIEFSKETSSKISILEERIRFFERTSSESKKRFKLLQMKRALEIKLKNLENQNYYKTQTIGEIKTQQLESNKVTTIIMGFLAGLILGIFLVFVSNLIKTYRASKA